MRSSTFERAKSLSSRNSHVGLSSVRTQIRYVEFNDSNVDLFMYLIEGIKVRHMRSATFKLGVSNHLTTVTGLSLILNFPFNVNFYRNISS